MLSLSTWAIIIGVASARGRGDLSGADGSGRCVVRGDARLTEGLTFLDITLVFCFI